MRKSSFCHPQNGGLLHLFLEFKILKPQSNDIKSRVKRPQSRRTIQSISIRRHLDDIKKYVPEFVPEFIPEFIPEFVPKFDMNTDFYSGTNFFMSCKLRLKGAKIKGSRKISIRTCNYIQLQAFFAE